MTEGENMTFDELVQELSKAYRDAPRGEVAPSIILFGIQHADDLRNISVAELVRRANLTKRDSFSVPVNHGIRLAKYVQLKGESTTESALPVRRSHSKHAN